MRGLALLVVLALFLPNVALAQEVGTAQVRALAVAQQPDGTLVGSTSSMTIRVLSNGTGNIYVSTVPLAQIDMQGSAKLAVKLASVTTGIPYTDKDFLILIKSDSTLIGGPSAGGILTVATIAALEGWAIRPDVLMTGTINPDGTIGPVGGVPEKAAAAAQAGAKTFVYPEGQDDPTLSRRGTTIPQYCQDTLHITCTSVSTIEDATRELTGHTFTPKQTPTSVRSDAYARSLQPRATSEVQVALGKLDASQQNLNASRNLIPASLNRTLQATLDQARASIAQAVNASETGKYYTTASRTFQASIESTYVDIVVTYATAPDAGTASRSLFENATILVSGALNATRALPAPDVNTLQFVGAAQSRGSEAQRTLAMAKSGAENASSLSQLLSALHDTAYAEERANTATWWATLGMSAAMNATPALEPDAIKRAAEDAIADAEDTFTYANILVQESGADASQAQQASASLDQARNDLGRGLTAAALFEALDANVRASLAIELIGVDAGTLATRTNLSQARAEEAISASRARGIEPVMAESYQEFAQSLPPSADKLAFLNQAKTVASLGANYFGGQPLQPRGSTLATTQMFGPAPLSGFIPAIIVTIAGVALGLTLGYRSGVRKANARAAAVLTATRIQVQDPGNGTSLLPTHPSATNGASPPPLVSQLEPHDDAQDPR